MGRDTQESEAIADVHVMGLVEGGEITLNEVGERMGKCMDHTGKGPQKKRALLFPKERSNFGSAN
jgi:hypothetical protein